MSNPTSAPLPIVSLDWSFHGVHVSFDGASVELFASTDDLLTDPRMASPHRIAAESTFESWDLDRRQRMIDAISAAGHELVVYRPLHTPRARQALGLDKSDANDARAIWKLAAHPKFRMYTPSPVDPAWMERAERMQREYTKIRLSGEKPRLAAKAAAILGPLEGRSPEFRAVFGGSGGYSETLLSVLYFLASEGLTRNEMERAIGLHGSGYPSLLRSEIHTHSARHARKRLAALPGVYRHRAVDDLAGIPFPGAGPDAQKDWRVYRRQLRHGYAELFAGIHSISATDPEGTGVSVTA